MARVVILGAGIAGHTAALHLRRWLARSHEVVVVSPNADWNWIPSNIWVGVGRMDAAKVLIPLKPIYQRKSIRGSPRRSAPRARASSRRRQWTSPTPMRSTPAGPATLVMATSSMPPARN